MKRYENTQSNKRASYYLSSMESGTGNAHYILTVTYGDEFACAVLESNRDVASKSFEQISRNGVLPCTLRDVLEDMDLKFDISAPLHKATVHPCHALEQDDALALKTCEREDFPKILL